MHSELVSDTREGVVYSNYVLASKPWHKFVCIICRLSGAMA